MKKKTLLTILCVLTIGQVFAQIQLGSDILGESAVDQSGFAICMPDSITLAIGGPQNDGNGTDAGHVRIYTWNGSVWTQKGNDINGENSGDWSGISIDMPTADVVAIGARDNNNVNGADAGHVRVYMWNGSTWIQKGADIDGEAADDGFGRSVSMPDANTIAIGASSNDETANNAGHTRVFEWNGNAWIQKGVDIDGEPIISNNAGFSVSMPTSDMVAISAPGNDANGINQAGHVKVYRWTGTTWIPKGNEIAGDSLVEQSGYAVSMPDTNTIAIGSPRSNINGTQAGRVRVFEWNNGAWVQKGSDLLGEAVLDYFGSALDMVDSNTLVVGARRNDANGSNAGHVRVFRWNGTSWYQDGSDLRGDAADDEFGWSVSMPTRDIVAIGAPRNDIGGNNAGQTRVYQLCPTSMVTDIQTACTNYTFNGQTYTSSGIYTDTLTNSGGCDSIVTLDLTINQPASGTDVQTACGSYAWIDGNTYTSSNNTPNFTLSGAAANGCDSTVNLDLAITTIDSTVTQSGAMLIANQSGASYQWIDCDTGNPIVGETSQTFTASSSGNYAVEVTINGCISTSACQNVTISQAKAVQKELTIQVYPNPTTGQVNIEAAMPLDAQLRIVDMFGKEVKQIQVNGEQTIQLDLSDLASGVYTLSISDKQHIQTYKLVKQ